MNRTLSPMEEEAISALRECGADEALANRIMAIISNTVDGCLEISRREIKRQVTETMAVALLIGVACGLAFAAIMAVLARAVT